MAVPVEVRDAPLISVVMPVYNAGSFVADAIRSILAQTYSHFEFIIVDDGSSDGSAGIVREFAARDARIRPLFLGHRGQALSLNAGIALANGEYIAYMEHDDIALPERLMVQLAWMCTEGLDLCGGSLKCIGDREAFLWFPVAHQTILHEMLFRIAFHLGSTLVRTEIAKAHRFDESALCLDYEMFTRLAPRYRLGNVPQVILKWRRYPEAKSHRWQRPENEAELRKFRKPYFHSVFPEATEDDYDIVDRVAEHKPFGSLTDLQKAGVWLVRLAESPDLFLRQRMAMRWLGACHKSAGLGLGCYRVYQQIASQFGVPTDKDTHKFWLACALRLRPESRIRRHLRAANRYHPS